MKALNPVFYLLAAAYAIQALVFPLLQGELRAIFTHLSLIILLTFSVAHGWYRYGLKNIVTFFVISFIVGWSYETSSILTSFPFGHYYYSAVLGAKLWLVPYLVMLTYFSKGYICWNLAQLLLDRFNPHPKGLSIALVPVFASFIMVMWDLCLDPLRSTIEASWIWLDGGAYFGVPFENFLGWLLCVFTIFILFAIYGKYYVAERRVPNRHLFAPAVFMYAAGMFDFIWLPFFSTNHQVITRDGHSWWTSDIYQSMSLVGVFTMLFVTLLLLTKLYRLPK